MLSYTAKIVSDTAKIRADERKIMASKMQINAEKCPKAVSQTQILSKEKKKDASCKTNDLVPYFANLKSGTYNIKVILWKKTYTKKFFLSE